MHQLTIARVKKPEELNISFAYQAVDVVLEMLFSHSVGKQLRASKGQTSTFVYRWGHSADVIVLRVRQAWHKIAARAEDAIAVSLSMVCIL